LQRYQWWGLRCAIRCASGWRQEEQAKVHWRAHQLIRHICCIQPFVQQCCINAPVLAVAPLVIMVAIQDGLCYFVITLAPCQQKV
jgi:hypothetical protein